MDISVQYTPDLRRSFRLSLWLCRKSLWSGAAVGVLLIILGVAFIGNTSREIAPFLIAAGVVLIIETPLLLWMRVYRNREILLKEVEVALTSEGIQRRTATVTFDVTWDMVERIYELNDFWVFAVNRLTRFGLFRQRLTEDQQAELAAFIAAWPVVAREKIRGGMIHHLRVK